MIRAILISINSILEVVDLIRDLVVKLCPAFIFALYVHTFNIGDEWLFQLVGAIVVIVSLLHWVWGILHYKTQLQFSIPKNNRGGRK